MNITLSSLHKTVDSRKKRLGRGLGSGKGAKSGKGTTRHQAARENIPLHFEGGQGRMVKKYPLLRGKGKNKSVRQKPMIVNLTDLNSFADGATVDVAALRTKGIIQSKERTIKVKVLLQGELKRKLQVKLPVSRAVKDLIEKAGGNVLPV
jgi:large subunit ribosomal protein L15